MLLLHRTSHLLKTSAINQRRGITIGKYRFSLGLGPAELSGIYQKNGAKAVLGHVATKLSILFPCGAMLAWMIWIPYNRERISSNDHIFHAWMAVQAVESDDPVEFASRPEVRAATDFQSITFTDMNKGNTRLVLFESPDAMYLAVRGPKENQADHLLKTNRLDASDDLPRDLTHSGILKFMEGVPVFNIFDDSNWFDRHLVVCGSGMGGMMAHNLVLQELYKGHISASNHRVRSIGFGAPFCNHKKNRDDLDRRMWKDMFLTVMNKDDPLPAMISATLDPKLLDNADNKMKEKFEKYKASLNRLLADKEKDLDTKKGLKHRTKLEEQLVKDFNEIKPLLPEEAEFKHFDPIGNFMYLDPAGGMPHVDEKFKDKFPDTQELIWKRKDLRKAFYDRHYLDNPNVAEARQSSYNATIRRVCMERDKPATASRALPIMNVVFPVYIPPKWR
jgi:hypothetical protein